MGSERDESHCFSSDSSVLPSSNLILSSSFSSITTRGSIEKSFFTIIDPTITSTTEIEEIVNIWMNKFKENPKNGTIKLFAVIINCFDIDVCEDAFINFNSVLIFARINKCFETLAKTGSLISPEKVKKSVDVQKSLELFTEIFHFHSNLFLENDTNKSYFIFLRDILTRISQSNFVGPRLLATSFGLKIVTGFIQSNNIELVKNDLDILLTEFLTKRWKDTICFVREKVLLELTCWINIDSISFINEFWMYIYWALGDQSTSIQTIALKISNDILSMHSNIPKVKMLINKIVSVLANLLLSTNDEVVISALNLYSILPSIDEENNEEDHMNKVESIALELIFSEKSKIARVAAKHFMNQMVNSQPNVFEQLKVLIVILEGVPSQIKLIATSFFVNAIYDLCPILTDFKLISQLLTLNNLEDTKKHNFLILFMYVVKWLITGVKPEHKIAFTGDQNDIIQLHINTIKKIEYTTYMVVHLLNQFKECNVPTHAFSLWILLQFIDFKLLQNSKIISEILDQGSLFYHTWNIPTILEMISKCIHIMTSNLEGSDQSLCLKFIKDIAEVNINILKAAIENPTKNTLNLQSQKNSLIKIWSLAKYNLIPEDLKPLKYLSYYVTNLNNNSPTNLIVSEFALSAFMEVFRKTILKVPKQFQNNFCIEQSESIVDNTYITFLNAMLITSSKYELQVLNICETAFLIVNDLLRIRFNIDKTNYILDDDQNIKLNEFIFSLCNNCEYNDDLNTLRLVEVFVQLIQDGLIEMNHLITLLQFVKKELIEHVLEPVFNYFCKKETGDQLSDVINLYLVYMYENIISQKSDFKNYTLKDLTDVTTIITRILCQCIDQIGRRLVSTNIHRHGIQYAMSDSLSNPYSEYPFKQFFWILVSMCDTLIPYDAQRLASDFISKPATQELINSENEYVLGYLYKLLELCDTEEC
ncbi:uncharacterized protein LOC112603211 [Melanaphis sacchari]|uniref:uncharacterized protein LOC112603211 n=1 Tax=Melanaphis sacchari TaxID=742174 RepID=UPI000DC13EF1|nr:uncharacterized protein LOC112603211 [Melanaphis sacchari]